MTNERRAVAAKFRISLPKPSVGIVMVFALALGGIGPAAPAFGQTTPGTAGPVSLGDLFTSPDSVELKPGAEQAFKDAARSALDSLPLGQCPKPGLTITVVKGDDLFQQALADARRDVLLARLPFGDRQKFTYVPDINGTTSNVEINASLADTAPPTITVDPPTGTKVKVGQRLTITATATEPTPTEKQPRPGWQAGIRQIQIEDLARHTGVAFWNNPAPTPRPCDHTDLTKQVTGSYVVPNEPVARLKITARDYHNPQQTLSVEYPTGDWYGKIKATIKGGAYNDSAEINYALSQDPEGTLTGRGRVVVTSGPNTAGDCTYNRTVTPKEFDVEITGSREGDNLRLDLSLQGQSTWMFTSRCIRGGGSGTGPPGHMPFNALASIISNPRIRIRARDGAQAELPPPPHPDAIHTRTGTIEIHQAQQ